MWTRFSKLLPLAFLAGVIACRSAPPYQGMEANDLHALAELRFREGDYDEVERALNRLFVAFPSYTRTPEARLLLADAYYADEQYITAMYRPYFAKHDELGGTIRANVMDRLLQFDLDRSYGNDPELSLRLCEALSFTVEGIDAGFVDAETLERWRKVAFDVMGRTMDWERMRGMISNHLRYSGLEEGETLKSFLDSLPELLDETIAYISSTEVDAFVRQSTDAARAAVERYLACG